MSSTDKQVNGSAAPTPTIEQVRELLFGQEQRTIEAQMQELHAELAKLRSDLLSDIGTVRAELEAALKQSDQAHRERFAKVGRALEDVGRTVGALSGN